ncbi:MAG: DHH family phosphoesterase [Eubacterium sp.]|nr:DHH family phosphoesterase [Eubacterium sp.]
MKNGRKGKAELTAGLKGYLYWPLLLTIIPACFLAPVYYFNVYAGVWMSCAVGLYFVICLAVYKKSNVTIVEQLSEFALRYGSVQKRLLDEFEIPYALLTETGKILWMNCAFEEVTGKEKNYHKSINGIFPSVTKEWLEKAEDHSIQHVKYEEKFFRILIRKVFFHEMLDDNHILTQDGKEQYLSVLYLFDETELNDYVRKNEEQRLVSALVYIDNYDEVLESVEDVKQSMLAALVARRIIKYFSGVDGVVKRVEKDRYYVVFKHKYLEQLKEDRFSLIEDVKKIRIGNEMAVTLSIGIGVNSTTYVQNHEYARMAVDLALGRGGDQVVIKEGNEVSYYGGNTQQSGKNARVKARVKAYALREIIESHENIVVMGHSLSDVDCFGAAIGIFCAAKALGKRTQIVLNEITSSLRPLKECFTVERGYEEDMFITSEEALDVTGLQTLVMVVDSNRPSYTECPELLNRSKTIVVFDHHRQSKEVIDNAVLSYIESYASSTCEMVAEVLQYIVEGIQLEPWEADCIYAGVLIDTNNFMTKTGVRTFEAAAYLRRSGADVTRVRKMLRNDMDAYKARAEAVRSAEVYRGAFAISTCPADRLESPTIAGAQAANELLNIIGIKASFVLTDYNDKIYISSRSIDEINVQVIMERLGGGGHLNVAGAQLEDMTIEKTKQLIENTIDELMEEGQIVIDGGTR